MVTVFWFATLILAAMEPECCVSKFKWSCSSGDVNDASKEMWMLCRLKDFSSGVEVETFRLIVVLRNTVFVVSI